MKHKRGIAVVCVLTLLVVGMAAAIQIAQPEPVSNLKSPNDADGDGIDDYTDMVAGARRYIATDPMYLDEYYEGGYPDEGYGVCTDVIWQAFDAAGYDLKAMVDEDIAQHPEAYGIETPDPNIDFRRVRNLRVFFEQHAEILENEVTDPEQWQPGDIAVFNDHIGMCSDRRNRRGIPYILHHANAVQGAQEADVISRRRVTGHYRWNPAQ